MYLKEKVIAFDSFCRVFLLPNCDVTREESMCIHNKYIHSQLWDNFSKITRISPSVCGDRTSAPFCGYSFCPFVVAWWRKGATVCLFSQYRPDSALCWSWACTCNATRWGVANWNSGIITKCTKNLFGLMYPHFLMLVQKRFSRNPFKEILNLISNLVKNVVYTSAKVR